MEVEAPIVNIHKLDEVVNTSIILGIAEAILVSRQNTTVTSGVAKEVHAKDVCKH